MAIRRAFHAVDEGDCKMIDIAKFMQDLPPYLQLVAMVWMALEVRYSRRMYQDHLYFFHGVERRVTDGKSD